MRLDAKSGRDEQLLEKNIKLRLGCRSRSRGMEDIHDHPWFAGLDWDALENKEITPAFTPDVRPSMSLMCA